MFIDHYSRLCLFEGIAQNRPLHSYLETWLGFFVWLAGSLSFLGKVLFWNHFFSNMDYPTSLPKRNREVHSLSRQPCVIPTAFHLCQRRGQNSHGIKVLRTKVCHS